MAQGPWPDESAPSSVRPVRPTRFARQERRLDLQEVLSVLWFRKWSILAITLLTVAVALLVSSRQTPIYQSAASILVTPIDTGAEFDHPGGPEPRHRGGADLLGRGRLDRGGQPRHRGRSP